MPPGGGGWCRQSHPDGAAEQDLRDVELTMLNDEETTLTQVGCDPQEQWIEFMAVRPEGCHIAAREIFMLHDLMAMNSPTASP